MKNLRKNISVHVDEYFDAAVTLSMDEIKELFESCSPQEKSEIKAALRIDPNEAFEGESVIDQLKVELMTEALNRYTLDELEARLK